MASCGSELLIRGNSNLHRIQNFDPSGVGALDLKDCLRLQLSPMPETVPYRREALLVVTEHLDLLATHEQTKLMRKMGLSERQLDAVVTLYPLPGTQARLPHPADKNPNTSSPMSMSPNCRGSGKSSSTPKSPRSCASTRFTRRLIKRANNSQPRQHLHERPPAGSPLVHQKPAQPQRHPVAGGAFHC